LPERFRQRTSRCRHEECGESPGSATRTPDRRPVSTPETTRWPSRPGERTWIHVRQDETGSARAAPFHRKDTFMDWHARTQRLWQHTCCHSRCWSAARLCDRCGAHATSVVVGVSIADAMARSHPLDPLRIETNEMQPRQATADLPSPAMVNPREPVSAGVPPASERRLGIPNRPPSRRADEEDLPAPRLASPLHPDLERALVFGLWLLSGLVCAFMTIGAVVEFERANYVRSFTCAISAAAAPTSVIAFAIDGWFKHHRSNVKLERV
jgi:hypothetical protein